MSRSEPSSAPQASVLLGWCTRSAAMSQTWLCTYGRPIPAYDRGQRGYARAWPGSACARRVRHALGGAAAAIDSCEFAFLKRDGLRRALSAGIRNASISRRPLRSAPHWVHSIRREIAGLGCAHLRRVLGPLGNVERPLDLVFEKTMAKHGAGMINQDQVSFCRRRTQATACHLPEQADLFCWPARTMQLIEGRSKPSVKTWQLQITWVSPDAKRARVASRSDFGVIHRCARREHRTSRTHS